MFYLKIVMCSNIMDDEERVQETLAHELIHAYDMCTAHMSPDSECLHHACTEIRAANLSGQCNIRNRLRHTKWNQLRKHHQECVRSSASQSIAARPICRGRVEESIAAAWPSCYKDTRPFDVVP